MPSHQRIHSSKKERPRHCDAWPHFRKYWILHGLAFVVREIVLYWCREKNDALSRNLLFHFGFNQNSTKTLAEKSWFDSRHSRRVGAESALKQMLDNARFTTRFSTEASVLQSRAFLFQWEPCTIQHILDKKATSNPLQLVVLGGSCSAQAAANCSNASEDPLRGRYSDILQSAATSSGNLQSTLPLQVHNMAQGGTNSIWNALVLDELVDPLQADVLLWEYLPNDDFRPHSSNRHKLDLWLKRVQSLYQQVNKPPPPLLLLYLWEPHIGRERDYVLEHGLERPLQQAVKYIDKYKRRGWNIQVIHVPATITNITTIADNPKLLLDDDHHPNCEAVHLIANMIQYALLLNIATCADPNNEITTTASYHQHPTIIGDWNVPVPEPIARLQASDQRKDRPIAAAATELWNLLTTSATNVRVGSLTPWQPRLANNQTNLHVANLAQIQETWPVVLTTERALPSRNDRKYGFVLPPCRRAANNTPHNHTFDLVLLEPHLLWLGFSITKAPNATLRLSINGGDFVFVHETGTLADALGMRFMRHWIQLEQQPVSPSNHRLDQSYTISLCDDTPKGGLKIRQIVGIMVMVEDTMPLFDSH